MSTVLFDRHGATYTVRFRYDPALIELVKAAVPSHARSWNPATKEWTVSAGYAERLAKALRATGHQVIGLEPSPADPPPRAGAFTSDMSQWARILFRRVGPTRRDPIFRALTKVVHPDNPATGDTAIQRELNAAREELDR
ncbi:MAG TPA: hypothetical protein VME67_19525 [Mycobacterium sp.]|nr:hypothetical protein [Mycobacterium sp.]HTX96848.1 hypothetical protein [Mycobacterium sp.]